MTRKEKIALTEKHNAYMKESIQSMKGFERNILEKLINSAKNIDEATKEKLSNEESKVLLDVTSSLSSQMDKCTPKERAILDKHLIKASMRKVVKHKEKHDIANYLVNDQGDIY